MIEAWEMSQGGIRVKKKIAALISAMLLLLSTGVIAFAEAPTEETEQSKPVIMGVEEDTEDIYLTTYEEVASNSDSILYADMQKGHFALQDKSDGHIWYSTPNDSLTDNITIGSDKWGLRSQLIVRYLFEEDVLKAVAPSETNSQLSCIEEGSVTVKKIPNGIRVDYYFGDLGVTIPAEYCLQGDSLSAKILLDEIDEGDGCLITDINLLPSFGAGNAQAEGQLLVPDGCGALINFNNGRDRLAYESMIYGEDLIETPELKTTKTEAVRLPVFATLMDNTALMGIVKQGDGSASIRAVNGNENRGYNAVSTVCHLRSLEHLTMFEKKGNSVVGRLTAWPEGAEEYEVVYTPLKGEEATYVGVAEKYRNYLIEEKGLTAKVQQPSLSVDIYGGVDVKATFLGFEYSKIEKLTTFSQAQTFLEKLYAAVDMPLSVRYLGWSGDGILNKKTPAKATAMKKLGGQKAFTSLAEFLKGTDSVLYTDVDLMQFRKGSEKRAIKNVFNETVEQTERLRSVFTIRLGLDAVKFITPQDLYGKAETYLKSVKQQGLTHVSLSTIGNLVYSNNSAKNGFHRYFFTGEMEKILKLYHEAGLSLSVENGNAYAAVYADRIYDAPTVTSGYDIFDEEIPFYQIVFHGYVTMTTTPMAQAMEASSNILKTVESGSELLYGGMYAQSSVVTGTRYDYLYSTEFSLWENEAVATTTRYRDLLNTVYDETITGHRAVAVDVMETTFSDGTRVLINYTEEAVTIDGVTVNAGDYAVMEGVTE